MKTIGVIGEEVGGEGGLAALACPGQDKDTAAGMGMEAEGKSIGRLRIGYLVPSAAL